MEDVKLTNNIFVSFAETCHFVLNSGEKEELASAWCKVRAMIQVA